MRWIFAPLFFIAFVVPAGASDPVSAAARFAEQRSSLANPVAVVGGWQGTDSKISARTVERITDSNSWVRLWARHAPGTVPPEVDFSKVMIVAVFSGSVGRSLSPIWLHTILESHEIEIVVTSVMSDAFVTQSYNPYLLVQLARSDKSIVVVSRSAMLMSKPQVHYQNLGEIREANR